MLVAGAVGVTALLVFLAGRFPGSLSDQGERAGLTYNLIWLVVLVAAMAVRWRARPGLALRHAAVWVAIGAALVLAYSFRFEAGEIGDRFVGELVPSRGIGVGAAMTFQAEANGHFVVDAEVNGARVQFLVDTGATDVALTLSDARRIGIDTAALNFYRPYRTANGQVYGAPVRLEEVSVGVITLHDVAASVSQSDGQLSQSLLGMTFLSRLSSYEVSQETLTLRQ